MFKTIKLSQLRHAPANVRNVAPKTEGIEQLAASIAANGVIQNLVGYKEGRHFHIVAGGRRLRALELLQQAGTIDGSYEVPVSERTKAEAVELSLHENEQRENMHPADSVRAFALLRQSNGWGAAEIAARFGYDEGYVEKLMTLGSLAPELLAAMGEDRLGIPAARALCLTDDPARQIEVFNQHGDNPQRIRQALTTQKVRTDFNLFKYVGREAYETAGGTYTRDLFSTDGVGYADDPGLVEELAEGKLAAVREDLCGMGWKEVVVTMARPDNFYSLSRLQPQRREPNETEAAQIEEIESQISEIEEAGPESEELGALGKQLEEVQAALLSFPVELRAQHKALAFVGYSGELEVTYIALRPQTEGKRVKQAEGPYSKGLIEQLTGIRSLALQMAVAADPALAMDILIDSLAAQLVHDEYGWRLAAHITATAHNPNVADELLTNTPVTRVREEMMARFADIPADRRFETIRGMEAGDKMGVLAVLVASTISATVQNGSTEEARIRKADQYADAAGLDLAALWGPGVETFGRIRKGGLLAILREECGNEAADNCSKLKGEELARAIGERLPHRWLPAPMLPLPPKLEEPVAEDGDVEEDMQAEAA